MVMMENIISCVMQPQQKIPQIIPPAPHTTRGEPSFLQSSPTHLLYYNGPTAILRPHTPTPSQPCLTITHNCPITAVKFSHGYRHVASIDEKGTLLVHIVEGEGQGLRLVAWKNYEGFYAGAKAIDWTADDKRICVVGAGKNRFGRVVAVQTGTDVGQITAVSASLNAVAFRPQKPYKLASGGQEHTLKFYEGPPYKFHSSKKSHTNFINGLSYSPDGKHLVSVSTDRKIVLYNGLTFQVVKELEQAHNGGVMGVAWIDQGCFVTGGADKKVRKWGLELEALGELNASQDQGELGLIDSFVVAVCYCKQKGSIFFVLLSGQIKQADKDLKKILNSYEGHRNKPLKILPIPNSPSALLLDSNGKILSFTPQAPQGQVHRHLRSMLCHNKLLIDLCISPTRRVHCLTGEEQVIGFYLAEGQEGKEGKGKEKIVSVNVQGAMFLSAVGWGQSNGFVCYTRDYVKVYQEVEGKYEKVVEAKLAYEPTCVFATQEQQQSLLIIGSGKGHIELFTLSHTPNSTKLHRLLQSKPNPNKITQILYTPTSLLLTGDSMGSIRISSYPRSSQSEPTPVTDPLGSHTTMITALMIKGELMYSFSMDNKWCTWKVQGWGRIGTVGEVHRHGILGGAVVGDGVVSCGGDLLAKVHQL